VFLATGVSVFPGATIGARIEVRVNGVVHVNSRLPDDVTVPIGWIAVGNPAQVFPPVEHDELWAIQRELDFPKILYGVERPEHGDTAMPEIARGYSEFFGRHMADKILG
jgi:carbonic anhydrase/acetyltransferase-like protein (isoleucine patch superfamily)